MFQSSKKGEPVLLFSKSLVVFDVWVISDFFFKYVCRTEEPRLAGDLAKALLLFVLSH